MTQVQVITPHLVVSDAAAALEFYKKALGAVETFRLPTEDGKKLMHSEITFNGARIFVFDDFSDCGGDHQHGGNLRPPSSLKGTTAAIHLEVKNCDEAVKRAEAAGAKVTLPPWDAFWGARYAQILDPFGHAWSFAHPLPQPKS